MLDIDLKKEKSKFYHFLQNSKKIVLINHRRMDGDAYGSLIGFYNILKKIGNYEIICLNDDKTPDFLKFLGQEEIFQNDFDLSSYEPDLIIGFDIASIEQMGEVYKKNIKIFTNCTFVNIDHHLSNNGFGNINIVDISSSSTCELIWSIIKEFGFTKYMDSNIATFLLTGIITDTNSFINTNSTTKSFFSSSELMSFNPRHQDIIINLFKKKPFNKMKLWGEVLKSLKNINNGKIVWNIITKNIFEKTKTTNNDLSGLVDEFLITIDGLDVAFLLYEIDDKIKGTFRSKTDKIDLNQFCMKFGGGGHLKASGFLIKGRNIYEVENMVIDELKKIINLS